MLIINQDEKKVYSDGSQVEKEMLGIARLHPETEASDYIQEDSRYTVNNTFSPVRHNLLNWYPFRKDCSILEVGAGMGGVTGALCDVAARVVSLEMNKERAKVIKARFPQRDCLTVLSQDVLSWNTEERFDYVVVVGVLEYAAVFCDEENPFTSFVSCLKKFLKPDGVLLLAIENRFGLKYWLGASEDHLQQPFAGIAGYKEPKTPRTFSKFDLEKIMGECGFTHQRFYYVLPDYKFPKAIYTDSFLPSVYDLMNIGYTYAHGSTLVAKEQELYQEILKNGVFPFMANSYLVEASAAALSEEYVLHVSGRGESKPEHQIVTYVTSTGKVYKKATDMRAIQHVRNLVKNAEALQKRGIAHIPVAMRGDMAEASVVKLPLATSVVQEALKENNLTRVQHFIDMLTDAIQKSSAPGDENALLPEDVSAACGMTLRHGYMDMNFNNAFYDAERDQLIFFDQEWDFPNLPLRFMLYYACKLMYARLDDETNISWQKLLECLHVAEEETKIFDALETKLWQKTMKRTGDVYGEDGYCNLYGESLLLKTKQAEALQLQKDYEAQAVELNNTRGHVQQLIEKERNYLAEIARQGASIGQLTKAEAECREQCVRMAEKLTEQSQSYAQLEQQNARQQSQLASLTQRDTESRLQIAGYKQREDEMQSQIADLSQRFQEQSVELKNKQSQLASLTQRDTESRLQIAGYKQREDEMQSQIADLSQRFQEQSVELKNKKGHIELLLQAERDNLAQIGQLQRDLQEQKDIPLRRHVLNAILPMGTRRRFVIKMGVKTLRHPIRMLGKLSRKRLQKLTTELKNGDISLLNDQVTACIGGTEIQTSPVQVQEVREERPWEEYEKLTLPVAAHPLVSIVIPAYNQFQYTYECIKSIIQNSGDVPYEVILADDCSTDQTVHISQVIENLHVVRTNENLRFLLNCNHAAKKARGQYILFLNNDTQVQQDWLKPLVTLMESNAKIGMVGSKLIYPDGRLQEAGGILWKDGSAWNYGNKQDASLPQFNYVKEADYISGAAIMIRTALWNQLGGFDTRFAPAYYEDTDLAFMVRQAGYLVMYQPKSVVVHFEGVSNGTDTSTGLKAYQQENAKRFYEKWKQVLETEHNPNAEDVFLARDRALRRKKTLLMVDHYVPMYDKDAGSRAVFSYLQLFVQKNYNVKFIGDNFYPHQPYTDTLQQMGIEVLYGNWYHDHWKEWLAENGKYIDYAFLNRPHIAVNYIDLLREHSHARIAYFGHDLHFLREQREYEISKDPELLASSKKW